MTHDRSRRLLTGLGFAALSLVWGTQFLVIKAGQLDLPPLLTVALRFAVLATVAEIAVIVTHAQAPFGARLQRVSFGMTQAVSFGLLYWAQSRIPSALAGVLSATSPLLVAALAYRFVPSERFSWSRAGALLLGFVGVSIIAFATRSTSGDAEAIAVAAILFGELASATNKVLAKRLTSTVSPALLLRDMGLMVTVLTGLASFFFERKLPMTFAPLAVLSFVYLGFVASFGASALYLVLLRRHAVTAMAYLQFAPAMIAAIVGVLLGGERLGPSLGVGVVAVLSGLLLLAKGAAKKKPLLPKRQLPQGSNDQ